MTIFASFQSTVNRFVRGRRAADFHVLEDPITGAPAGLQSRGANGPDGIWAPVQVTAAQIASPSALMIADLNATYQLNVAPWSRYRSDGTNLVLIVSTSDSPNFTGTTTFTGATQVNGQATFFLPIIAPENFPGTIILYAPVTITAANAPWIVASRVSIRALPA